jgi:uncharacterized protein YjbI with pentapeptide repeats
VADLSVAALSWANLSGANLNSAILQGADLCNAILSEAFLSSAHGITNEELELKALSLDGATMPNFQKYEDWLKDKEGRKEDAENG